MQSKGSVFIFLAILAFPIIAISVNHNIFFGASAVMVTVISFRYIYSLMLRNGFTIHEIDTDLEEELEELVDIDIRKFGAGLSVVYNLVVILFLSYCAFYLETLSLKAITTLAILMQVYFITKKVKKNNSAFDKNQCKPQILLASISNIAVVLFTVLNKISRIS